MLRMDDENNMIYLKYGLQPKYFVDRITYFKGLAEKSSNPQNKKFFNSNSIPIEEDFKDKIKGEEILNKYYSCAFEKLMKDETIKILENGIFIYNGKLLLYCVKNDNMTGIKNRALVLESLVNFYFRQLKIVPLPSLLINLNYKKSDKKNTKYDPEKNVQKAPQENKINLFFEFDGCYLFEGKNDITFSDDIIKPFNKETKYKVSDKEETKIIQNDILIKNNSIVLIEVKTHFPKLKEEDQRTNLENIIKMMFIKLNYFVDLYHEILQKKFEEIKLILLYDQNRLSNYENDIIINIIDKNKDRFQALNKYDLYFDIDYIIPSIGKISLNYISQKLQKLEEENQIIKEENKNIKEQNKNIKKEKIKSDLRIAALEKGIEEIKSKNSDSRIAELEKELEEIKKKLNILNMDNIKQKPELKNLSGTSENKNEKNQIAERIGIYISNNINEEYNTTNNNPEKILENNINNITESSKNSNQNQNIQNKNMIDGIEFSNTSKKEKINKESKVYAKKEINKENEEKAKIEMNNPKQTEVKINNEKEKVNPKVEKIKDEKIEEQKENMNRKKNEISEKKSVEKINEVIEIKKNDECEKTSEKKPNNKKNEKRSERNVEGQDEKDKDVSDEMKTTSKNDEKKPINTSTKDKIYQGILSKIENKEELLDQEKSYKTIYDYCYKQWEDKDNFDLTLYKNNHISGDKGKIADLFHEALRTLTKEQREQFFYCYGFYPCMSVCYSLK